MAIEDEVSRDCAPQLFVLHLFETLIPTGAVECSKRNLLTPEERAMVKELQAKGLMSFPDEEINAAIIYVLAGLLQQNIPVVIHWDKMAKLLAGVGR